MKALFRFMRGELLSGFYLKNIQAMMNVIDKPIRELFTYMHNVQMQWEGDNALKYNDLYGIGKIAGVFLPAITTGEGYGSLRFTSSHLGTNGRQYEYIDGLVPLKTATGEETSNIFNASSAGFFNFWLDNELYFVNYSRAVYRYDNFNFVFEGDLPAMTYPVGNVRYCRFDGIYLYEIRKVNQYRTAALKFKRDEATPNHWTCEGYCECTHTFIAADAIVAYRGELYRLEFSHYSTYFYLYKFNWSKGSFEDYALARGYSPKFNLMRNTVSYITINPPLGDEVYVLAAQNPNTINVFQFVDYNTNANVLNYIGDLTYVNSNLSNIMSRVYIDAYHVLWYRRTGYEGGSEYIYGLNLLTGETLTKKAPKIYKASEEDEYNYLYMMTDGKRVYYSNDLATDTPYVEYSIALPTDEFGTVERSERGLFERTHETFEYVRQDQDDYPTDINTLADPDLRSGLVGMDDEVQGYIASEETGVLDLFGNVKPEKVLETPPTLQAYTEFYGDKFMFLPSETNEIRTLDADIFYAMYERLQYIRYNGISIFTLCNLIHILMLDGLVTIQGLRQVPNKPIFELHYVFDPSKSDAPRKEQRLFVFKYIMNAKYKQIKLVEQVVNSQEAQYGT